MNRIDTTHQHQLRQRLDAREAELSREVRSLAAEQEEAPGKAPRNEAEDDIEQSTQRLHEAVRHVERERDLHELSEITAARARLEAGTYGSCADCGIDIPRARLQAQPWAARCIACQEKLEKTLPVHPRTRPTL